MESKLEYYSRLEEDIIRAYREAEDDETRDAARMLMNEHRNKMLEWESLGFYEVYRAYRSIFEDGTEFPDFNSAFNSEKIKAYVRIMRENGIKHFTYSSTRTNAIKGAWDFEQAGAKLEGMVEINTCYNTKVPALKFTIE